VLHNDIQKAIRENRYEINDSGDLYLPRQKVVVGGGFFHEVRRGGDLIDQGMWDHNLVVNEGLNHLLNVTLNNQTQTATWYVGLYKTAVAPAAGWTAATIHSNATKADEFDETTLPEYVEAASTAQSITNSAAKATFTMNATVTINGAYLKSNNVKLVTDTTGILFAASQFTTGRDLVDNDELLITYTVNATST
jgi:hypothetical protein